LKVETVTQDDYQVKLTVTIEPDQLDDAKQRAAKKISRSRKIPGFRPGKAPYPVVARTVGDATLVEEAIEILVDEVYPEALDQAGVDPYGPGVLNNVESMDPPIFEFIVPLAPSVVLGDYHGIRIPYETPATSKEEISNVLEELREGQAIVEPMDQPSQPGDVVYLTLQGEAPNPADPEQKDTLVADRKMNILIQASDDDFNPDEWPFPGFNQELVSVTSGNTRTIEYEYPDEERFGIFRNRPLTFTASIEEVFSRELPELDDEFAQSLGEYESLDALEEYVATSLQESATRNYDEEYNQKVLDQVVELSEINFPPQMLEHELEHMVERLENQLSGMGMDLAVYLKTRQLTREGLENEMKPEAELMIKRSLALLEILKVEEIQIDRVEIQEDLERTMDVLSQSVVDQKGRQSPTVSRERVENQLINRRLEAAAFNRLKSIASAEIDTPAPSKDAEAEESVDESGDQPEATSRPAKKKQPSKKKAAGTKPAKTESAKSRTKSKKAKKPIIENPEGVNLGKEEENG
jgi:trigger factor